MKLVDSDHAENLADVEAFAKELTDRHLACRELGHLWRAFKAGHHPDGGFTRTLRCNRCYTKRLQELSERGMVLTNHYVYPEGYESKGVGRIVGEGRGLLRLESIKRVLSDDDEE